MKTKKGWLSDALVPGLILALLLNPLAYAAQQEPAPTPTDTRTQPEASTQSGTQNAGTAAVPPAASQTNVPAEPSSELPDSPGTVQGAATQSATPPSSQAPQPQQAQQQPQDVPHKALGTAAAEAVPTSGVAASRPAGAALAPAKQRRVRSILIKVGALVGVGVAVGTTLALSQGSPSRPPGAN